MACLLTFLVICCVASSQVEARESVFFSKVNPVRRYSQFVSSSMPAFAPLPSAAAPAPAPAPFSEVEPASQNYDYGTYGQEDGEFPVAAASTVWKTSGRDEEARFGSRDENQRYGTTSNSMYNKFNNYEDDEYSSNNNVHNYKYTGSYDDTYNTEDGNNDQYADENSYYTDKFERGTIGGKRFVDSGSFYENDNGDDGHYERPNEYNSMEKYEGVYQP